MEKSFCYKCGAKLVSVEMPQWGFNSKTGEIPTKAVCPTGICEHEGIDHQMVGHGFIRALFSGASCHCVKCGEQNMDVWELC